MFLSAQIKAKLIAIIPCLLILWAFERGLFNLQRCCDNSIASASWGPYRLASLPQLAKQYTRMPLKAIVNFFLGNALGFVHAVIASFICGAYFSSSYHSSMVADIQPEIAAFEDRMKMIIKENALLLDKSLKVPVEFRTNLLKPSPTPPDRAKI